MRWEKRWRVVLTGRSVAECGGVEEESCTSVVCEPTGYTLQ